MALSYMQEMCLYDRNGNVRCPWCGKYRKREDIPDQDAHAGLRDGHINMLPACKWCLEKG